MRRRLNTDQKLQEYTVFIEDSARFSDRRQTVHNTQVAIHAAFLAAVALLTTKVLEGTPTARPVLLMLALVLLIAALLICIIWHRLTTRYKEMIGFRCKRLEEMEKDIVGSHKMICRITCRFKDTSFSDIEAKLPWVFMGVYSVLILGVLVGLCLTCCPLKQGLGALLGCP
jgi:hypothetical protein